jgi:hypothetical protein
MATPAEARRTRREVAKAVRERRRILPRSYTTKARKAPSEYAERVLRGEEPRPEKGTAEGRQLARMGSYSRLGRANPEFFPAFRDYFYHKETS